MTLILSVEICQQVYDKRPKKFKVRGYPEGTKILLKNQNRVEMKIENLIAREGVAIEEEKI